MAGLLVVVLRGGYGRRLQVWCVWFLLLFEFC